MKITEPIQICLRIILVATLAGLVCAGCGRKGPPLPPLEKPAASESGAETETQPLPKPTPTPEQKDSETPPAVPPYP